MPRRRLISERDVLRARREGQTAIDTSDAVVTPAARDAAARHGIALDTERRSDGEATLPSAGADARTAPGATSARAPEGTPLRVTIGADHGGVAMKDALLAQLRERGATVHDVGTFGAESVDYPDFAERVAKAVATGAADLGIMIDGAGIGSCMVANKIPGVRAAMCHDVTTAANAREHNNANLLTLGGSLLGVRLAQEIVRTFVDTPFAAGRHARRVDKIDALDALAPRRGAPLEAMPAAPGRRPPDRR